MGAGELSLVPRLRREDYKETKHDADFSKWQTLVGPNDWEDYSKGKEGVARYRVHNLPNKSGPGLYELGIAIIRPGLGRDVGKLDPDDIVVVYLGQADNVRSRLQRYGRSGSHLGNRCFTTTTSDCKTESPKKGRGLFEEIFSRGYSIVFRWAPMKTKRDAEETEAQLLDTFDYAWNKGSNCARRPDDIFQKISEIVSTTGRFLKISRVLLPFTRKKVGIEIKRNKLVWQKNKFSADADEEDENFLFGIFRFSRSRPRIVSDRSNIDVDFSPICGIITNGGTSCTRRPVPGRKRCEEHKGRRIYGFNYKPITEGLFPHVIDVCLDSSTCGDQKYTTTCSVNLGNGTFCGKQPIVGKKRCEEHKGMRVNALVSKSAVKKYPVPDISSGFCASDDWMHKDSKSKSQLYSDGFSMGEDLSTICGMTLRNGSLCRRKVKGNKRCWQHREQMNDSFFPTVKDSSMFDSQASFAICGVTLHDGSICERTPVSRRKRCEQHKGMRVTAS